MHTEETAFVRQPATDLDPVVSESKERKVSFERFLDAVITFSLSATVFGVPLFFTSLSLQGISFDKSIYFYLWVLLAAVAWAIKGALRGELIIRRTPLDWPLLALLAAATISMIFAADRWHSFWGSFGDPSHGLMMLLALAVFYIIAGSHLNEKRLTKVFVALLCAGALVTIWTFLGLLSMPFLPAAWAAYSPLSLIGSVKGLALFLAMMVPLFISGTFSAARSLEEDELPVWKRALLRPALALLLVLSLLAIVDLYMLFSYTPWLALVAGLVFFLIYILAHIVKPAQVLVWLPMLAVVMVAAFMMIGRPVCAPFSPLALCRLPAEIAPNPSLSWEIAREGVKENLFFGAGPAMYGEVFAKNHPPTDGNALFTVLFYQGEGALFEALATIGPVGTFLAMILLLTYVGVTVYLLSRDKESRKFRSLGLVSASLIAIVALFLMRAEAAVVIMASSVAVLALLAVFFESGTPFRQLRLSLTASPKFALTMAFVSLVLIVGVAMAGVYVGKVFLADIIAGRAVASGQVSEETVGKLSRAIGLYPREGRYFARLAQEYMVLANREAFRPEKERDAVKIRNWIASASSAAAIAVNLMPNDVFVTQVAAGIAENQSFYDPALLPRARELYEKVTELEPGNVLALVKQGDLAIRQAAALDPEKEKDKREEFLSQARDIFGKAISLTEVEEGRGGYAPAYYQRALVNEALGDLDAAVEDNEKAFLLSGRANISYVFNLARLYQQRGKDDDVTKAEQIYKEILGIRNKQVADEINVRSSLATLYAQKDERDKAIEEYRQIMKLLPEDAKELRQQVQKLIEQVSSRGRSAEATPEAQNSSEEQPSLQEATAPSGNKQEANPTENAPAAEVPAPAGN